MPTAILDTAEAVDISTAAQGLWTKPVTPAEKYPKGFTFNRLRRDGGLEEMVIKRYLPDREIFIVGRSIGDFEKETEMPLARIEAMTAPELEKFPVGTNVIVPLGKGKKEAGKVAGYLKESDEYIVRVHEKGEPARLLKISNESFEAVNYKEVRKKVLELLH
jgi:hypothetical protein